MLSSCLKVHMMLTYNVFGFILIFPHCIFDQLNLMLYICMCLIVTDNVQVSIKFLFCSVLFCSVMFYYVLFCYILFCSVLCCYILFCSVLFCYVLLCSVLLNSVLFCYVLFYYVLFCSVIVCSVLFCSVHKTGLSELTQIELNHKMLNIVRVVTFHVYNLEKYLLFSFYCALYCD